jgi:hypothetical protein
MSSALCFSLFLASPYLSRHATLVHWNSITFNYPSNLCLWLALSLFIVSALRTISLWIIRSREVIILSSVEPLLYPHISPLFPPAYDKFQSHFLSPIVETMLMKLLTNQRSVRRLTNHSTPRKQPVNQLRIIKINSKQK